MIALDTHAWLWWLSEPREPSATARRAIQAHIESGIAVSALRVWEVALLHKRNGIERAMPLDDLLAHCERLPNLESLPMTPRIGVASVDLEPLHADPADRWPGQGAYTLSMGLQFDPSTRDTRQNLLMGGAT